MDPIAWLETGLGKLVASIGIAVLLVGFGWVRGNHHGYDHGQSDCAVHVLKQDRKGTDVCSRAVASFDDKYDAAAAKAAEQARVEQEAADAKSVAQAQSLAAAGQAAAKHALLAKAETEQRLSRAREQLAEEMRHDQQAAKWAGACIPGGIRGATGLGGVCHDTGGKG